MLQMQASDTAALVLQPVNSNLLVIEPDLKAASPLETEVLIACFLHLQRQLSPPGPLLRLRQYQERLGRSRTRALMGARCTPQQAACQWATMSRWAAWGGPMERHLSYKVVSSTTHELRWQAQL